MRDDDPLGRSIQDWGQLFTSASYLRPVGHGDMSTMDREMWGWVTRLINDQARVEAYTRLVSAVLNRWPDIVEVCSEPYLINSTYKVAKMAIRQIGPNSPRVIYPFLQQQFDRLWTESPRPHDETLRFLALNFGQYFPISRVDAELLFHQPGWEIVALRIASTKGRLNDSIAMKQDLHDRKVDLSVRTIQSFVEQGFPKIEALRWLLIFREAGESAYLLREQWEAELIASGMTRLAIYGKTK